jgi:molybdopterin converting factor subunit 1
MTRVRILYFAAARDAVGLGEEAIDLPADVATIGDVARHLARAHPSLEPRMSSIRIARNERFADDSERIASGDVLALLPPVAGG